MANRRVVAPALVLLAFVGACRDEGEPDALEVQPAGDESPAVFDLEQETSFSVFDLKVGFCFTIDGSPEEVEKVDGVPCDEAHTHEVYLVDAESLEAAFDVYPGAPDLEAHASQACFSAFRDYVGTPVIDSAFTFTYVYPTLQSWTQEEEKDRTFACVVVSDSRTGSVRKSMG